MTRRRLTIIAVVVSLFGVTVHVARSRRVRGGGLEATKEAYLEADDLHRRRQILLHASSTNPPGVAGWLAEIADNDPSLAIQAASALGALSDKSAAGDLLSIVSGNASTLVRANAARALGKCGGPAEAAVLATTSRDPRQPLRVRQEAALALGKIGDDATVPALIAIVEQTAEDRAAESEQLRISALQALGEMSSAEARRFLVGYARGHLSPTERAFVARAVRQGG